MLRRLEVHLASQSIRACAVWDDAKMNEQSRAAHDRFRQIAEANRKRHEASTRKTIAERNALASKSRFPTATPGEASASRFDKTGPKPREGKDLLDELLAEDDSRRDG